MKYYIASKLENHAAVNRLRDRLKALGHEQTYDWTTHGPVYRSGLDRIVHVADAERNGVYQADFVVVLLPGGRGTHVEMGIAIGLEKTVVFISDVAAHHEATAETCAFYHHSFVRRYRTVDEAMSYFQAVARKSCAKSWRGRIHSTKKTTGHDLKTTIRRRDGTHDVR
jgi:nucleoside 2-deoxyribosyltransferase